MMEKITYGAPRLVDWVAQIKAGAATVRVHFAGGALTQYGVTPAEYTTENPFIQRVIENSRYFKEGRILILRRTEIETPAGQKQAEMMRGAKRTGNTPDAGAGNIREAGGAREAGETRGCGGAADSLAAGSVTEETVVAAEEGASEDGVTVVEASCLQDAQAYLQENFGISSYKVRSYEAAQRAASEHGVRFAGEKF